MTREHQSIRLEGRMHEAVTELQGTISRRYPSARFSLSHPEDEPTSLELTAVVDVDDPDEVLDAVIDRVVKFQVDEHLPIHVVPIRTPERIAAYLREHHRTGRRARRSTPLLGRLPLGGIRRNDNLVFALLHYYSILRAYAFEGAHRAAHSTRVDRKSVV